MMTPMTPNPYSCTGVALSALAAIGFRLTKRVAAREAFLGLAAFHLGEYEVQKGDLKKAYSYYQYAASSGGQLGKRAQQRMQKIYPQQQTQQQR